jgi:hypothetical protein
MEMDGLILRTVIQVIVLNIQIRTMMDMVTMQLAINQTLVQQSMVNHGWTSMAVWMLMEMGSVISLIMMMAMAMNGVILTMMDTVTMWMSVLTFGAISSQGLTAVVLTSMVMAGLTVQMICRMNRLNISILMEMVSETTSLD